MEYQVMPDIREKEKVVGGIFTITQTVPLVLGAICGGVCGLGVYNITGNIPIGVFVIVLVALPFLPFAFIKIEKMGKMELFFYLLILLKYKNQQKVYINLNENKRNRLVEQMSSKEG